MGTAILIHPIGVLPPIVLFPRTAHLRIPAILAIPAIPAIPVIQVPFMALAGAGPAIPCPCTITEGTIISGAAALYPVAPVVVRPLLSQAAALYSLYSLS